MNKEMQLALVISAVLLIGIFASPSITGAATFWEKRFQKNTIDAFGETGCEQDKQCETNYCEFTVQGYKTTTICTCPKPKEWNGTTCIFQQQSTEEIKTIHVIAWLENFISIIEQGTLYIKILDNELKTIKDKIEITRNANGNAIDAKVCQNKDIMITWQEGNTQYGLTKQYVQFLNQQGALRAKTEVSGTQAAISC